MDVQQARDLEALIPNLRRYARVLVRDHDRADDIVQDCLERAISRHHLFAPGTNLRAWLFTILVNLVRSEARRDKARGTVIAIEDYHHLLSSPAGQDGALRMRDLKRAYAKLAEPFREVIVLIALEGFSYEEAAEVIGVPVGTVRSRLFRAREQLKRHMEERPATGETPRPAAFRQQTKRAQRVRERTVAAAV